MTTRDSTNDRAREEWEAQERALQDERQGRLVPHDARLAEYRLLARVLRNPPLDSIPEDFAAQTAARAELGAVKADDPLEVWLQRGLVGVLLLAGVAAGITYSANWLRFVAVGIAEAGDMLARAGMNSGAVWALAIASCVAFSAVLERMRRRGA